MAIYLDCNATTPLDPRVRDLMLHYMEQEFGNAGSRTHEFGAKANQAVEKARRQVAAVVDARPDEVVFTSGATEANNLALFGLVPFAESQDRKHIVSTQIEHKAVLEPLEQLGKSGFEIELIPPNSGGWVEANQVLDAVRPDTLLVSVMHANNETGVRQPISDIVAGLIDSDAFMHVDAAQTYGKEIEALRNSRIDMITCSGHKVFGPKGVGALIARRRGYERVPLTPLFRGGGQERGLRAGTLAVPLIAGLGLAAELAQKEQHDRSAKCIDYRRQVLVGTSPLAPLLHGDQDRCMPNVLNLSLPGIDSEAAIVAVKDLIAISNGSACTSTSYEPSHVLRAMGVRPNLIGGAVRLSWCHSTPEVTWPNVVPRLAALRG